MNCPQCNAAVNETDKFCQECGFNLKEAVENAAQAKMFSINEDGELTSYFGDQAVVEIPDTVVKICGYAFNSDSIEELILPATVREIEDNAFFCLSDTLKKITVKEENPQYRSVDNCLIDRKKKRLILGCADSVIPTDGSVKTIGLNAFMRCGLVEAVIPKNITTIEDGAFQECEALSAVSLPEGLLKIGNVAFAECTNLASIHIPASVTEIEPGSFAGCTAVVSVTVDEKNAVYTARQNCLIEKKSKTLLSAFKTSVIPEDGSVTTLGGYAFSSCEGLDSIHIPAKVTEIEVEAFFGWYTLKRITVDSNNPAYHTKGDCLIETSSKRLIRGFETSVIPNDGSVTVIGESAFEQSSVRSILIPAAVVEIGCRAFAKCSQLSEVRFEGASLFGHKSHLVEIGYGAFRSCEALRSIDLPPNLRKIGVAFEGCKNLAAVKMKKKSTWLLESVMSDHRREYKAADPSENAQRLSRNFSYTWTLL